MPAPDLEQSMDAEVVKPAYSTGLGTLLVGSIEDALDHETVRSVRGKVDLLFTSPPFPLVRKKRYGNKSGDDYLKWLRDLAPKLAELLSPTGSLVIEVGNAWEPGVPEMSTLPLRALLAVQEAADLRLCQQVICHNPARLPSPAQWVNVKRSRLKDSYTHVWWLSKTSSPKADNRRVLLPYSEHMKKLLKSQRYNAGRRPSGHVISETGFLKDQGGSISANVIELDGVAHRIPESLLRFSNTAYDKTYVSYCESCGVEPHPARMRMELVAFFIEFLTDPNDLVFDPFAGSNTTGAAAESLGRRWMCVEAIREYALGSQGRFLRTETDEESP